jgi:hypothetical protein
MIPKPGPQDVRPYAPRDMRSYADTSCAIVLEIATDLIH